MRIGLIASRQHPFLEYVPDDGNGQPVWRCWMMFNSSLTGGTYFEMFSNGHIERVTINSNEIVERVNYDVKAKR